MKKILPLIVLSVVIFLPIKEVLAQSFRYANEALLFSRTGLTGSARVMAMGGVQTSLGGDISSVYSNPAGLGFYNRSDISLSPTFFSTGNNSTYLGNSTYDFSNNLNISNIGLVLAGKGNNKTSGWLGGNIGISYQRINNFNDQFSYEGENASHGMVDLFIDNYINEVPGLLTDLAYSTYLVGDYVATDENGNPYSFYSLVYPPNEEYPYLQRETVTRSGSQNQFSISYGGNISDKYYIGAGVGFVNLDYRLEKTFSEIYYPEDEVTYFDIYEEQIVRGSGINATLGLIARPVSFLTVGISYQTPTFYTLDEDYYTEMAVNYNNVVISDYIEGQEDDPINLHGESVDYESSEFIYTLRTPSKLAIGSSFFFGKSGFISTDLEFINFGNSRLTDNRNLLGDDNDAIQSDFGSAVNVRIGGEYRFDNFRLRAGYAHQGDPYVNNQSWNRSSNTISGGGGVKFRNYYADIAVAYETGNRYYYPYAYGDNNVVEIANRRTTGLLTVGLTF